MKRVFIGSPAATMVHAHTMLCAMALCLYEAKRGAVDIVDAAVVVSPDICHNMNTLANDAIKLEADYLFVFETDNTFPPDALETLLAHERDIVGCAYSRKAPNAGIAAAPVDESLQKWPEDGLVEMRVLPFGCALISTAALKRVGWPYFIMYPRKTGQLMIHDEAFSARARDVGLQCWADAGLSRKIGHIGSYEFKIGEFILPQVMM